MNGQIKSELVVLDTTYKLAVEIPTSKPIVSVNAFTLAVFDEAELKETPTTENVTMLAHVAASFNPSVPDQPSAKFPENFFLQLSPPASILPNIQNADKTKTTFAIKSLSVEFASGKYNDGSIEVPGAVKGEKEVK